MTFFEFVLVMASVIYALSVAPLLSGVVRIAQTGFPVRHYLPQAIWAGNIFVTILLAWWSLWAFRAIDWTFSDFIFVILEPVLLFFACSLLYPQHLDGPQVDMKSHFEKIGRLFFAAFFTFILLVTFDGVVLANEPLLHVNRYFTASAMAIIAWAYLDRRTTSQLIAAVFYSIALTGNVGMSWFSPPG